MRSQDSENSTHRANGAGGPILTSHFSLLTSPPLGLFEGVGVELEYMIVDAETLDVLPVSDRVLAAEAGALTGDVEHEDLSWSNELSLHVIEFKTTGPAGGLAGLDAVFARHVGRVNEHLAKLGGRLMPTAMHPWMDPLREAMLWPHDYNAVYAAFDRIFGCRGHGWSNLQSMHVNLPFADDEEFGRLHAAVRLVLPILPALAAASPIVDGRVTGVLDNRLEAYRGQCAAMPSISGRIVPEPVFTMGEYQERILTPIYRDLAAHDPDKVLQEEWANARGAIARFERNTIEIRVIDMQECPSADLAIAAAVTGVLRGLVEERWCDARSQRAWRTEPLADLFDAAVRDADETVIADRAYLAAFGWNGDVPCTAGELWRHVIETIESSDVSAYRRELEVLLDQGPLARRVLRALGDSPSRAGLESVYRGLCDGLSANEMFADRRR